jgi:hypothetical protein
MPSIYGDDFIQIERQFKNMTEKTIIPYLEGVFDIVEI